MDDTGTGQAFTALIHQALRVYHCDDELARLARLTELAAVQAQRCGRPGLHPGAAVRAVLKAGLDELAAADRAGADLLARHYIQGETIAQIAHASDYSESYLYKKQRQVLTSLAQHIWQAEVGDQQHGLTEALALALAELPPPTYSRLFGVGGILARVQGFLAAEEAHWLTAIDGLGGIGKTALARTAVEALVRAGRFTRVRWLTARQHYFAWGGVQVTHTPVMTYAELLAELWRGLGLGALPALGEREIERGVREGLGRERTVIVLDNLETAADVRALVAGLDRLARPAKVLVTTRHRIDAYEGATSITAHELPVADALAFIHYHAVERNVAAVLAAPLADLARIVNVTGGCPLAIKLVVGQMHARPLDVVLNDLAGARAGARDLYQFIFRYSWAQLSAEAKHLLLHMPLLDARGAGWEELAAISGLAEGEAFWRAVDELVARSLLNAGCAAGGQMLYAIHRLTEHFILSDLVHRP